MLVSIEYSKLFFYFEPSFFLFIGKLSSFKFKTIINFYYVLNIYILNILPSILRILNIFLIHTTFKLYLGLKYKDINIILVKWFNFFKNIFVRTVSSVCSIWNKQLRLIGIGYKVYHFCNLLVLKIGYSHYIIYLVPYELRLVIVGRKKRNFILFGINKLIVGAVVNFILCLRVPNIYTNKGIRLRGRISSRKAGKKSQF